MTTQLDSSSVQAHIDSRSNPHNITKDDILLDLVRNYPVAIEQEAFDGTVADRYVTPASLKAVFDGVLTRNGMLNAQGNPVLR